MDIHLAQALAHLKGQIKRFKRRKAQSTSKYDRESWDNIIEGLFESGLNMIKHAGPGDINQDMIDYFLGRTDERPDLKELKRRLEEKNNSAE